MFGLFKCKKKVVGVKLLELRNGLKTTQKIRETRKDYYIVVFCNQVILEIGFS